MRRVRILDGNGEKRGETIGYFHCWGPGYDTIQDENNHTIGVGIHTTAIIEKEDGTVKTCRVNEVEFLDKPLV